MIVTIRSDDDLIDWGASGDERIVQNALNIIRTRKFEVPFMRDMGLNPDFIDNTHIKLQADILSAVTEALSEYEGRVKVLDVWLDSIDKDGKDIAVVVKLEV